MKQRKTHRFDKDDDTDRDNVTCKKYNTYRYMIYIYIEIMQMNNLRSAVNKEKLHKCIQFVVK